MSRQGLKVNRRHLRKWKELIGRTKEDKELDEKLRRGMSFEELVEEYRKVLMQRRR